MQVATIIISNATVGRNPESGQTPSGTTTLKFSVAVNHKSGGNEFTDWYNVQVFGRQAETLIALRDSGSLTKGARVDIVGRLSHRPYRGRDGSEKLSLDVNANDVILVSPPKDYQDSAPSMPGAGWVPPAQDTSLNDVPF